MSRTPLEGVLSTGAAAVSTSLTYVRHWHIYPRVANRLHTVVETPAYLSKAGHFRAMEREEVVEMLAAHPMIGKVIKGTGGLRKARTALTGRGKRGGARVIYWFHSEVYPAVLLWAFAKNEADDLTAAQRKVLMRESEELL